MTSAVRVVIGDITVTCNPELPFLQRYTARHLGYVIRLRASRGEVFRALVGECGLSTTAAARLLNRLDGGGR
ncbi:hypothetical protein HNR23_003908 [Nocardiopsis mwathae]|uniref:Uncharacterized protein n=1 Tax=Nocardiopsis mwathae TaxID=1472723 RepID=A0A7W9YKI2_9ACTN|nr:hypothetical protein [Nocardiopsis mwathae]MBB6173848.1 hypothetical protein [Nocardiopsis mwathae]